MQSKNTGKDLFIKKIEIIGEKVKVKIGKKSLVFTIDTYEKYALKEEQIISKLFFKELVKKSEFDTYYFKALALINKDGYTSSDLVDRLIKKGATKNEAYEIRDTLSKANLLDDREFASNYVDNIAPYKLYGKHKVISKLLEKGVPVNIIDELSFSEESELEKAYQKVEKLNKKLSKEPKRRKKDKIIASLINDGFDYEIALKAIEKVTPNDKSLMKKQLLQDYNSVMRSKSRIAYGAELRKTVCRSLMNKGYEFEDIMEVAKENGLYEKD